MAYNKFIKKDGTVMLDLTNTTVSAETLGKDITAVDKSGNKIVGTLTDSPLPVEVKTEEEMTALLESGEVGSVYKYVGTSGTYENGALYEIETDPLKGTWVWNDNVVPAYNGRANLTFTNGSSAYTEISYKASDGLYFDTTQVWSHDTWDWTSSMDGMSIVIDSSLSDVVIPSDSEAWSTVEYFLDYLQINATKQEEVITKSFTKLILKSDFKEITITENGEYSGEYYSNITVKVPRPKLHAPTISLDGDILTITSNADNGAFVLAYNLYVDGSPIGNYTSTTIDLSTFELADSTYSINVQAIGTDFEASELSNSVSYEQVASKFYINFTH